MEPPWHAHQTQRFTTFRQRLSWLFHWSFSHWRIVIEKESRRPLGAKIVRCQSQWPERSKKVWKSVRLTSYENRIFAQVTILWLAHGNEHQQLALPQFWYKIFEFSKTANNSVQLGYWLARHRFVFLHISGYHIKRFCPTHLWIGQTKVRIQGPVRPKQHNQLVPKLRESLKIDPPWASKNDPPGVLI